MGWSAVPEYLYKGTSISSQPLALLALNGSCTHDPPMMHLWCFNDKENINPELLFIVCFSLIICCHFCLSAMQMRHMYV